LANVVLTPHIGSNTRGALQAIARTAGEDMARVLGGQTPRYGVN
jgi:phosphoglycerate dehydrogenase-like enzyme